MGLITAFMTSLFNKAISPSSSAASPLAGPITSAASTAADVIDTLFTSDEERLDKQAVLARVALHADALQAKINTTEARHRSRFVAGWRPFIGWVCGLALAWHFILLPLCQFALAVLGLAPQDWPVFDLAALNTILFGMLGLGTLRTAERPSARPDAPPFSWTCRPSIVILLRGC